jgi:hypothetical protein
MKRCGACGAVRSRVDFFKDASRRDGLQSHCIDCKREWWRLYNRARSWRLRRSDRIRGAVV